MPPSPQRPQRLLEGEVIDNGNDVQAGELDRLRSELRGVRHELNDLRDENAQLNRRLSQTDAPIARLRETLRPIYELLQMVMGEIDAIDPDDVPSAAGASATRPAASSPVWESWKQRMPGAPAKIIDALLLHADASVEQLVVLTHISRRTTIYEAIRRMSKAGIIDKNGGRFALKKLA